MLKLLIFASLLFTCAFTDYEAKVVKISDGDTIKVLTVDKQEIKIRLHGIDAPEKKQPFSRLCKQALQAKIAGKIVTVAGDKKDKYQRTIAKVFLDGEDVNKFMVKNGYAWAFKKYSKEYENDEAYARNAKLGLWQEDSPTPPWEFRKKREN